MDFAIKTTRPTWRSAYLFEFVSRFAYLLPVASFVHPVLFGKDPRRSNPWHSPTRMLVFRTAALKPALILFGLILDRFLDRFRTTPVEDEQQTRWRICWFALRRWWRTLARNVQGEMRSDRMMNGWCQMRLLGRTASSFRMCLGWALGWSQNYLRIILGWA